MTTSKHLLDIPFYSNDGDGEQCFQACIRSIINYYELNDKTLDELDTLSGRNAKQWTWTAQAAKTLHELGITCTYYLDADIHKQLDLKKFIKQVFGDDAEDFIQTTNIASVEEATKWIIDNNKFRRHRLTKKEMQEHLTQQHPLIILLDWNKVTNSTGTYQGHAVVITGFDENNFYVHDNGPGNPQKHMPIPYDTFFDAWTQETDYDVIVVEGVNK